MTTNPTDILEALHASYCALTGTESKFKVWERRWFEFWQNGFTQSDLECVLKWLMRENRRNDYKRSLSLLKLLDLEHFDAYLSEARAIERNFKPKPAAVRTLEAFRGREEIEVDRAAKTVGQVLKGMAG